MSHNVNAELRTTVAELESQLQRLKAVKEPFSSTPYPRHAPSLHEELLGRERQREPVSPLNFSRVDPGTTPPRYEEISRTVHRDVHVTPAMQSFNKLMEDTVSVEAGPQRNLPNQDLHVKETSLFRWHILLVPSGNFWYY